MRLDVLVSKGKSECEEIRNMLAVIQPPDHPRDIGSQEYDLYGRRRSLEATLSVHETNISGFREPYRDNLLEWEDKFRRVCLGSASISLMLLVFATFKAANEINAFLLAGFCLISFGPVLLFTFIVISITEMLPDDMKTVDGWRSQVAEIRGEVVKVLIPLYAKARKGLAQKS